MAKELITEDVKKVLGDTFKELRDDVALEVFTREGVNDTYNEAMVDLVKVFAELAPKIKPSFYTLDDEQAKKRNVSRSPTILVAPDTYRIRFTGAPLGEEGRSFIFAILMASTRSVILTEESVKRLMQLDAKRDVQVFVSPT